MYLKELPVGSKLIFGSYAESNRQDPKELVWTKVHEDGRIVLAPDQIRCQFDQREVGDVNRGRRAHGYNYFPLSNVFQLINSPEQDWFHPMHQYDTCGGVRTRYGFLSSFSYEELSALMPQDIEIGVPEGSRKKYGLKERLRCFVTLPSLAEVGQAAAEYLKCEGEVIPALRDPCVFRGWTRSGVMSETNSVALIGYGGSYTCNFCDGF